MPADSYSDQNPPGPKIGTILFLTGIFFINFSSRVMLAPLMPNIEPDLNLNHSQSGALFLMISIGYLVTMSGSGWVSSRIGHRRTIIVSTLSLGGALMAVSWSPSLPVISAALICLGLAAGLYMPSGIATITTLVSRNNWGKTLAVHEMAPNLALILVPLLVEAFIHLLSWRLIEIGLGLVSLGFGLAFIRFGKGGDFKGQAPEIQAIKSLIKQKNFWIMMALFSLGVGGSVGIYNMMTLYLVTESDLSRSLANTVLSFSRITGLFMAFVSGWAADRLGPKGAMTAILAASGLATLSLGFLSGRSLVVMVFIQAALSAMFFPAGFAALSRIGHTSQRSLVVSLAIPLAYVAGGGALPTIIGFMGQNYTFAAGMVLAGAFILTGPVLVRFLEFKKEPEL